LAETSPGKLVKQFWAPDLSGEELREAAWGFASALDDSKYERDRRARHLRYACQYLPEPIESLRDFESGVGSMPDIPVGFGRSRRNIVRTLVDTALSRFAKAETRVQFTTEGGTPAQQERGERNTDAANALLQQTDSESQLRRAALHACVFDLGSAKVLEEDDGPEVEHVPAWECMFDRSDAHRGKPTILVQRFPADRDALIDKFVPKIDEETSEERAAAIRQLEDDIRDSSSEGLVLPDHTATDQHCLVYELWRLPVGGRKGRHVVVTDKALLLDEVWTDQDFPFVFFGWSANVIGPYPVSIAAIVSDLQQEIDGISNRKSQIIRRHAIPQWKKTGTGNVEVTAGSEAIGDVIAIPPGVVLEGPSTPSVIGPDLTTEEDRAWAKGFEMTGINQNAAVGTRPAGLNSAPAQREWNEINQDRLSLVALDYQKAHVDLADRLLDAVAKIPDYEINLKTPNGRWLRKVKVSALGLDETDYIIEPFPIGALPSTPTGKLAAAADLLQAQAITIDEFRDIAQFPDLKAKLDVKQQARRAVEKLIAKMLTSGHFEPAPDILLGDPSGYAAEYAGAKYLEGIAEDMPQDRLNLLTNWIEDIKTRKEQAAAAKAPPPAPGPDGGGGGAPDLSGSSIRPITPAPLAPAPPTMAELGAAA